MYEARMLMHTTTIQARTYVLATRVMVRHEEKARGMHAGMITGESALQPPHTNKEGRRPDSRSRPRLARCARIRRHGHEGVNMGRIRCGEREQITPDSTPAVAFVQREQGASYKACTYTHVYMHVYNSRHWQAARRIGWTNDQSHTCSSGRSDVHIFIFIHRLLPATLRRVEPLFVRAVGAPHCRRLQPAQVGVPWGALRLVWGTLRL